MDEISILNYLKKLLMLIHNKLELNIPTIFIEVD